MTVKIPVRLGRSKYRAKPCVIDGIRFASQREASHYGVLKVMQEAGEIKQLELQPKFPIALNGKKICTYVADFSYFQRYDWKRVIVDCKGFRTPVYRLKKKLVEAQYNIEIQEV